MTPVEGGLLHLPNGRRVQLWEGGTPSGRPVLFFHGCPDTRRAAQPGDAAARRAGVRLIAVNRPGYGRSDPAPAGHPTLADGAPAVADVLQVDRFAVLGMSVGGPYALACAAGRCRMQVSWSGRPHTWARCCSTGTRSSAHSPTTSEGGQPVLRMPAAMPLTVSSRAR